MTQYSVLIKRSAIKELEGLPAKVFDAVDKKILLLESEPRPAGVKKLIGEKNMFRIRYRSFRVIYEINDHSKTITILKIKDRKEAY
ncbi:MAG: type II toxin-antitoxin system RelE/ParE family toxin [Bacteroidia bacterium]|nr:type II toxin-antitoxin system RelE/ParE family toxin [Bacteroidia bacterium]